MPKISVKPTDYNSGNLNKNSNGILNRNFKNRVEIVALYFKNEVKSKLKYVTIGRRHTT